MGIWTGRAAVITHARALGPGEALKSVLTGPKGHVFVGFVAAGLFGDALFGLIQACSPRNRGVLRRGSLLVRGLGAAALGTTAFQIYREVRLRREGHLLREITAWMMARAWGAPVIIAAGAIAVLIGGREILEGLTGHLREKPVKKAMGRLQEKWSVRLTRFGLAAHGTLIAIMGFFLIRAGLAANPRGAVESGGALRQVASLPFGSALLFGIAVGLIAYGLSQWVFAVYRRPS
jgi:hypothetical protein